MQRPTGQAAKSVDNELQTVNGASYFNDGGRLIYEAETEREAVANFSVAVSNFLAYRERQAHRAA